VITITLRQILDAKPCYDPRDKELLPADHDLDAPITFRDIAGAVDGNDVVWGFANLPGHDGLKRHFAVDCAERVRHLMTDERILNVLAVARRYAEGEATDEELLAARDAASDAASAAASDVACAAAWAAARAAYAAASDAASDAARDASAARAAAFAAARAAAYAASDASAAASDASAAASAARAAARAAWAAARAARDAAWTAELAWQVQRIIELTDAGRWERSEEPQ